MFVVVTSFYNASGEIVSFNITSYLDSNSGGTSFAPGDSSSFTATPTDNTPTLSSEIANYSLLSSVHAADNDVTHIYPVAYNNANFYKQLNKDHAVFKSEFSGPIRWSNRSSNNCSCGFAVPKETQQD